MTKADYVFCSTLSAFNEQSRILVSGDKVAWAKYLNDRSNGCGFLKAGIRVYMENARGIGIIKIRPEGETVWFYTNTEAVRRA